MLCPTGHLAGKAWHPFPRSTSAAWVPITLHRPTHFTDHLGYELSGFDGLPLPSLLDWQERRGSYVRTNFSPVQVHSGQYGCCCPGPTVPTLLGEVKGG